MFDVFDKANKGVKKPKENVTEQAAAAAAIAVKTAEVCLQPSASAQTNVVSLAYKLANLELIDLDESSKELLSYAKEKIHVSPPQSNGCFQ